MSRFLRFLCISVYLWPPCVEALTVNVGWLPAGKLTYEAFSVNPERLPNYANNSLYKSFTIELYLRHSEALPWGFGFMALQAGRTLAQERVGFYQVAPLSIAVQNWQIFLDRDIARTPALHFTAMAGVGSVVNQFERSRNIFVNGTDVSSQIGLAEDGPQESGIRAEVDNLSFPFGARVRWRPASLFFMDASLNYSFLVDFSDVIEGSSPFSGWATMAKLTLGRRISSSFEVFAGYYGYVNHMAAPTGQEGLTLFAGNAAPEGVYVLWQENEVQISSAILGFGYRF